jgi:hypothetical protein
MLMAFDTDVLRENTDVRWVGWHAGVVSLPPDDIIFAQPACPHITSFFVYIGRN